MRNSRKVVSMLCIVLCLLVILCGCNDPLNANSVDCSWSLANLGNNFSMHTLAQGEYLAGNYQDIAIYAKGMQELSRPDAARLSWSADPKEQVEVAYYTVDIQDFYNQYIPLSFDTTATYINVYNLCIGTQYLWRVTAHFADGRQSVSSWSYFTTEDVAPRNLYVDGITNVRDLGGWHTPEGRVRQGLIYRCGRLNESKRADVVIEITEEGIDMMRNVLGIKTEIDLRMPNTHNIETGGITSSPLGEDINYFNCPLEWAQGNYLTENLESVREFFALASDINNYPLIFHCDIGTDRTGMFAFLINGLLGVSEEDLYRDYLFSNFGHINNQRSLDNIKNNYLATINNCKGDTLSERIEDCLLNVVKVPQSQIDAIKEILLEY